MNPKCTIVPAKPAIIGFQTHPFTIIARTEWRLDHHSSNGAEFLHIALFDTSTDVRSSAALRRRLHRCDLKRVRFPIVVADRYVLAGCENVAAKPIARLIVVVPIGVIVEHPAGVLGAAGLVDQVADLVVLAFPEPTDAAAVPVLVPQPRVDMAGRASGATNS